MRWLRSHWRRDDIVALVSRATVDELIRVLAYPKFELGKVEIEALLADYLPYTEPVDVPSPRSGSPLCRYVEDQKFVDLSLGGQADVLVTGDRALREMKSAITIEDVAAYRKRWEQGHRD